MPSTQYDDDDSDGAEAVQGVGRLHVDEASVQYGFQVGAGLGGVGGHDPNDGENEHAPDDGENSMDLQAGLPMLSSSGPSALTNLSALSATVVESDSSRSNKRAASLNACLQMKQNAVLLAQSEEGKRPPLELWAQVKPAVEPIRREPESLSKIRLLDYYQTESDVLRPECVVEVGCALKLEGWKTLALVTHVHSKRVSPLANDGELDISAVILHTQESMMEMFTKQQVPHADQLAKSMVENEVLQTNAPWPTTILAKDVSAVHFVQYDDEFITPSTVAPVGPGKSPGDPVFGELKKRGLLWCTAALCLANQHGSMADARGQVAGPQLCICPIMFAPEDTHGHPIRHADDLTLITPSAIEYASDSEDDWMYDRAMQALIMHVSHQEKGQKKRPRPDETPESTFGGGKGVARRRGGGGETSC